MRVLHRVNLDVDGGVEHQFQTFLAHPAVQAAMRHDVVVGSGIHAALSDAVRCHAHTVSSTKRWARLPVPRWPRMLRARRLAALVAVRGPDAILSWGGFARPELTYAARRTGVPLVHREGGSAWRVAHRHAARDYLDCLAGAVCNTRASMRMLQLRWDYRGPARICRGGLRGAIERAQTTVRRIDDSRRVVLGAAGRLVAVKGMVLVLHVLAILRGRGHDVCLRVAGDGPLRNNLVATASRLGIRDYVHFEGAVEDMAAFYAGVDIFVHAALREPLGNVCIEAAAMGCVVVATRVDGLAETVSHGKTGLSLVPDGGLADYRALGGDVNGLPEVVYDPDRDSLRAPRCVLPDTLAVAVAGLVAEPATLTRLSAAAADITRQRFAFQGYVRAMIEALNDYAGSPTT